MRRFGALLALFLLGALADLVLHRLEGSGGWSAVPGFFVLFGLAAAATLVLVAKAIAGLGLQKQEGYYDD